MEFMNRGTGRPQQSVNPVQTTNTSDNSSSRTNRLANLKGMRVASVILLFSITVLIITLVSYLAFWKSANERDYVDNNKLQAVFLNGGQVYFGKILNMNDKYVRMSNIFYLKVDQTVQPKDAEQQPAESNISLVKLGCELHRPTSEMLINRDQVVFWENLKEDDSEKTVPGAVKKYNETYPNGQECQDNAKQQSSESTPISGNEQDKTDTSSSSD